MGDNLGSSPLLQKQREHEQKSKDFWWPLKFVSNWDCSTLKRYELEQIIYYNIIYDCVVIGVIMLYAFYCYFL